MALEASARIAVGRGFAFVCRISVLRTKRSIFQGRRQSNNSIPANYPKGRALFTCMCSHRSSLYIHLVPRRDCRCRASVSARMLIPDSPAGSCTGKTKKMDAFLVINSKQAFWFFISAYLEAAVRELALPEDARVELAHGESAKASGEMAPTLADLLIAGRNTFAL